MRLTKEQIVKCLTRDMRAKNFPEKYIDLGIEIAFEYYGYSTENFKSELEEIRKNITE
jgi:hypothetical protein